MIASFLRRQLRVFRRAREPRTTGLRIVRPGRRGPVQVVFEDAVVHHRASLQARVLQRSLRMVLKPALAVVPFNDRTVRAMRRFDALSARGPRSRYVEPYRFELGGVTVESMTHRYGPSSDMTILYFHGGGFFSCGIETHRRICERLALYSGATVISVDYVQIPEGTVADSVQDAITAYEALLDQVVHPDKVVVAGDSAGGYLSMKVAELATRRGLHPPAGVLAFSPLLSLDPDRQDKDVQRVSRVSDAYLPLRRLRVVRKRWLPEGAEIEGAVSPLEATEHIDSPSFLLAVEDEILRPEVEAMALLLAARGVEVETHLWRGQVHAFPVLADALPEARIALQLAARFARIAVGEAPRAEIEDDGSVTEPLVGELVSDDTGEFDAAEPEPEPELATTGRRTLRSLFTA
ncbi:hydrolase, alpha/beta domain protein [Aeromicrobium marinum DSM 15272]|uniref:Hydrolase, alpha/beta domain protein n=1 Tax=Aeromicrobium marinum DSM 15272 TaxID=585531 RepID=E2S8F0_9ACTN|nr:alpha/beta hydrolase [Aeromicrobium marinum]EFQ84455.1 hydrolase, alpha/beta domain protein [Aeromicrobium marinum DSM 15272]